MTRTVVATALLAAACGDSHVTAPAAPRLDVKPPTTTAGSAKPMPLVPTDVVDLSVLGSTACARRADGSVWCWGESFGLTPQRVDEATGATSVSVGDNGSVCFVIEGVLRCRDAPKLPSQLVGAPKTEVAWVQMGRYQGCFGTTAGDLRCWKLSSTAAAVPGVATVKSVAIGEGFACALEPAGTVRCWGRSYEGEMGDGTTGGDKPAGPVPGLTKVKQLAVGGEFVCALADTGTVQCWGEKPGTNHRPGGNEKVLSPAPVPGLSGVTRLFAAKDTVCATLAGDKLACWGVDLSPKRDGGASLPTAVAAIGIGDRSACTLGTDHHVRCWGERSAVGDGRDNGQSTPVVVDVGNGALELGHGTCAVDVGAVRCMGTEDPIKDTDITALAAGTEFSCAVHADHGVTCWGLSNDGQLGDREEPERVPRGAEPIGHRHGPVRVPRVTDAIQVATGSDFACALDSHGRIQCWGSNDTGQLGRGSLAKRASPAPVVGITDVLEIRASWNTACARTKSGAIWCWGSGDFLRNAEQPIRPTPFAMRAIKSATALALGNNHACVVLQGGSVSCWGVNDHGQLGDGGKYRPLSGARLDPAMVPGVSSATAIAAGGDTTCAIVSERVTCWGSNERGQAGGETRAKQQVPTEVKGISDAVSIAVGATHACARLSNGEARCWGSVSGGQLGANAPEWVSDLVEVRFP